MYFFIFCLKFLFARDDEFSPLKNGAGAAKDTAETSKNALFKQHRYNDVDMLIENIKNNLSTAQVFIDNDVDNLIENIENNLSTV